MLPVVGYSIVHTWVSFYAMILVYKFIQTDGKGLEKMLLEKKGNFNIELHFLFMAFKTNHCKIQMFTLVLHLDLIL